MVEPLREDFAGLINDFIVHDSASCGDLHVASTGQGGRCWKRPRRSHESCYQRSSAVGNNVSFRAYTLRYLQLVDIYKFDEYRQVAIYPQN